MSSVKRRKPRKAGRKKPCVCETCKQPFMAQPRRWYCKPECRPSHPIQQHQAWEEEVLAKQQAGGGQ